MRFYQPMMFVGLGGTGLKIGTQLYVRLREELCGPDGRRLSKDLGLDPYQLPSALQFVFADLDERDRNETARLVDARNSTVLHELAPRFSSFADTAASLRLSAGASVQAWLPPPDGEPRVAPLEKGAAALPTISRSALFAVLDKIHSAQGDVGSFVAQMKRAFEDLTTAFGQIEEMADGVRPGNGCDVFVGFSVAGGTGCGVFYDFLHFISLAFQTYAPNMPVKIYPLVVMPSAFDPDHVRPRVGALNAAPALLDLFRLVDQQNQPARERMAAVGVRYPGGDLVSIPPSTIQTAHLFSRHVALSRDDLHRSIVSLMLSMITTQVDAGGGIAGSSQSFASSFLNATPRLAVVANSGIGKSGVSTGLVAALTLPREQIAEIFADQLLGQAVGELLEPDPAERNGALREEFAQRCGLAGLTERPDYAPRGVLEEPDDGLRGAAPIRAALVERGARLDQYLQQQLPRRLDGVVPPLAGFPYREGLRALLNQRHDPFRVRRALLGHPDLMDERDRTPFVAALQLRAQPPRPPAPDMGATPPAVPSLRNAFAGSVPLRTNSPPVQAVLAQQNQWFRWRVQGAWASAWQRQATLWERTWGQLEAKLRDMTSALQAHQRSAAQTFEERCTELGRPRKAICYLIPRRSGDLRSYYRTDFLRALRDRLDLPEGASAGTIVDRLMQDVDPENGKRGWEEAFTAAFEQGPAEVLAVIRRSVLAATRQTLSESRGGRPAPLPSLASLLAEAAGTTDGPRDQLPDQLRREVVELLPAGFHPQGQGELTILVSYPSNGSDQQVERFLNDRLQLPQGGQLKFLPASSESLVVVMRRFGMDMLQVDELRQSLKLWMQVLRDEQSDDFLSWRQRLGYRDQHALSEPGDRAGIVQALFNALWDDRVDIEGDVDSPTRITIHLSPNPDAEPLKLSLSPLGKASSWASLVEAYEHRVLDDDHVVRLACHTFRFYRLHGIDEEVRQQPGPAYRRLLALADTQPDALREQLDNRSGAAHARLERYLAFWTDDVPTALRMRFSGGQPAYDSHEVLIREVLSRGGARAVG